MKYEFIKNGADDYTLKYKDKEIKFNSTVNIVTRLQQSIEKGKSDLIFELAKRGMTVKELSKEIKKDGKTYIDNSNYEILEKQYIEKAQSEVFMDIIEELFNKKFTDLVFEIGITDEKEMQQFGTDLGNILTGSFPSR